MTSEDLQKDIHSYFAGSCFQLRSDGDALKGLQKNGLNVLFCYLYHCEETEESEPGKLGVLGHQLPFPSKQNFKLNQLGGWGFFWLSSGFLQ